MHHLSLTACSFNIRKSRTSVCYALNHKINYCIEDDEHETTIVEMFQDFFTNYEKHLETRERQKTFTCDFNLSQIIRTDKYNAIYACISSGSYGSSSEIVDAEKGNVISSIEASQAVVKPFYIYIVIPKDNEEVTVQKGMFLFQNVGPFGVKTITTDYMKKYFSNEYNTILTCKTIAPKLFIDKMLSADKIKKLSITRNAKSTASENRMFQGYGKEERVLSILRYTSEQWDVIKNKIKYFSSSKANLFEFEDDNYTGLKITANFGGKIRTINMNYLENLSIIEAIPDEIRDEDTGHADLYALLKHFEKVTNSYLKEMVLQISD